MRCLALALPLLLAAASAPVSPAGLSDSPLARARADVRQATERLESLRNEARKADDEVTRLRAEQEVAVAAIEEAEAKIGEIDTRIRHLQTQAAAAERRLAERRMPLAALLAGLVTMSRQPPLLTLAEKGSVDEIVQVKALLDSTTPVIQRRSAALRAELTFRQRLAAQSEAARSELTKSRNELATRRQRFAELEAAASDRAQELAGDLFSAGDRVLASGEALEQADTQSSEQRGERRVAAQLAELGLAPARPLRGDSALPLQEFAYSLPAEAALIEGLGTVSRAGIASRGLRLATARGAPVIAPADGEIMFAAPYRGQDGIVIIRHPDGWTSLLLGVASVKERGSQVRRGDMLGHTLGPIGVELRRNGIPVSPALIAASSVPLSNRGNNR